jgi:leader peptidase (prepilin peptidase)/N-methyltransferase
MKPVRYIVAAFGASTFAFAAVVGNADGLALARLSLCGGALGLAATIDLAEHRIPNRVVLPAAATCAALTFAGGGALVALGGLALVALLLAFSLARPAALGMGDVKLALLVAFGLDGSAPTALLLGFALAALAGLLLLVVRGRQAWRRALPLAPFLGTCAFAALLI